MMYWLDQIKGDPEANRIVPPSGFTASLTVFTAAVMAFLAVLALSLSMAAGRQAAQWDSALSTSATLRVAPGADAARDLAAALRILETTQGVRSARPLSAAEQQALLAPWLGSAVTLEGVMMPQLIAINSGPDGLDAQGLRLRLAAEVPTAVFDDHQDWRAPLVSAAKRLRFLGWISAVLIAAAMAAVVTLAAQASLAANAGVIAVLRLVGARDSFIEQAFVRRFSLRALVGAAAGTALALIALLLVPAAPSNAVLTSLRPEGWGWGLAMTVPLLAAGVALGATVLAARRALGGLT